MIKDNIKQKIEEEKAKGNLASFKMADRIERETIIEEIELLKVEIENLKKK